jgi:hypothetical protein
MSPTRRSSVRLETRRPRTATFKGKMRIRELLIVTTCMVVGIASCRRSQPTPPALPTPAQVQAALARSNLQSPYKSYTVHSVEPLGNGNFDVYFEPTDYKGMGSPLPFPLRGCVTNNGYIVYCLVQEGTNEYLNPEGKAVLIPFEPTHAGDGLPRAT